VKLHNCRGKPRTQALVSKLIVARTCTDGHNSDRMTTPSEGARALVRSRHHVRLVETHEEGSAAADLPRGVYGFTGSAGLAAPLFTAQRYRNFEVHHRHDGAVMIVGFVTVVEAEQLRSSLRPIELTIYPEMEGDATEITAISYSRITHRQYSIRNTPGLGLQVSPELATT
jgi:hypothetical protein